MHKVSAVLWFILMQHVKQEKKNHKISVAVDDLLNHSVKLWNTLVGILINFHRAEQSRDKLENQSYPHCVSQHAEELFGFTE